MTTIQKTPKTLSSPTSKTLDSYGHRREVGKTRFLDFMCSPIAFPDTERRMSITKIEAGAEVDAGDWGHLKALPPCEAKDNGHWYCATHRKHLMNNFEKDEHIGSGRHTLAWWCREHGPEQP